MALVSDPSLQSPVFHIPYGMRYECLRDGACCQDWDVLVDAGDARRILDADYEPCSGAGGEGVFALDSRGQTMLRRTGGACNFLGPENLCRLHERLGAEVKPLACRQFPFRFIEAPDGVYVGLSFVCPSVAGGTGAPVEDQFDEAREQFLVRPSGHKLSEPVRFDSATPIEWEDYLAIERTLDQILGRTEFPVETCLVAGHVWLGILGKTLRAKGKPPGLGASQLIRYYVDKTRAEGLARCFEIARRPAANRALKRMLLGSFMSFRTALVAGRWRLAVMLEVLAQNALRWSRLGPVKVPAFERTFSHRQFDGSAATLLAPGAQEMLRRYFRHALFRKDIVRHTDLFWGYCFLVLCHGLIQWHAAALRADASGPPDPAKALGMVERYYVHHTNFDQLFLYHPALAEVFQYVFRKPNFAHSIIYG